MSEGNSQSGAKPTSGSAPTTAPAREAVLFGNVLTRREQFMLTLGAAVLQRQGGRTPLALANEARAFTDAFLEYLDKGK